MKVKALKHDIRFSVSNARNLGIQIWGENNDYPQSVKEIVNASATGKPCVNTYGKFIGGKGFADISVAEMVINRFGQTNDYLLSLIKDDYSHFGAFAIHVNYDLNGKITEKQHIPVETCRFEQLDENFQFNRIALHQDWGQRFTNLKRFRKEDIVFINLFNHDTVLQEIELCGGIENYKGQIFFFSNQGDKTYPLPIFDNVITDMNTEEGISNVSNRNARNSFMPSCVFIDKRNTQNSIDNDDISKEYKEEKQQNELTDSLKQFQGDSNVGKMLYIKVESDEEKPEIAPLNTQSYDKEFTVTRDSCRNDIGGAFGQPPILRAEDVKTGFSSDVMKNAYDYYNSITSTERLIIERAFQKLDKYSVNANPQQNYEIKPLSYDVQITIAEKIGKENLQHIFTLIENATVSKTQKIKLVKGLFDLTDEEINSILENDTAI